MNLQDLTYYRDLNNISGTMGTKEVLIQDMINDYNEANKDVITEFRVLINSDKAKTVKINGVDHKVIIEGKNNKNNKESGYFLEMKNEVGVADSGAIITAYDEVRGKEEHYILTSKPERIRDYEVNYLQYCNQTMNWEGLEEIQYCKLTSNSYGAKGEVHNNQWLGDFDSRIVIECQKNKYTDTIFEGMRLIFNHSEYDIYEVAKKIGMLDSGTYSLICKYSKRINEDDLENNIAFNPYFKDPVNPDVTHSINGDDKIVVLSTQEYVLQPAEAPVTWVLDEETRTYNYAVIRSQGNSRCVIEALVPNKMIELTAKKNNKDLCTKIIFTREEV